MYQGRGPGCQKFALGVGMMKYILYSFFSLFAVQSVSAAVIDFETVPGSAPADQLHITNQYEALYGISFSTSTGEGAYLEKVGSSASDSTHGFFNGPLKQNDVAMPGYESQLGNYFLRIGTDSYSTSPISLLIDYSTPVTAASAAIWDLDVDEQWLIIAKDGTGGVLDSITSPVGVTSEPGSLDGLPWIWSFDLGAGNEIYQIEIQFIGTKTVGIGLALDEFSPSSPAVVPVPAAIWFFGSSLLGLVGLFWRKKQPDL
jgi:hypothetical protein